MKEINDYLSDLKNFEKNLSENIKSIIIKNQGLILKTLKLRLFNTGIDGSGKSIEPKYTDETIIRKKKSNQRYSHVTLRDVGNFYAGMYVEYYKNNMSIYSSDPKSDLLTTKYGESILELTNEEQFVFINSILEPALQKLIDDFNSNDIYIK